jgi:hypothetical protein
LLKESTSDSPDLPTKKKRPGAEDTGEIVKRSTATDQPDVGNLFDELMPKKRAIREASSSSEDEEEEIIVLKKRRK